MGQPNFRTTWSQINDIEYPYWLLILVLLGMIGIGCEYPQIIRNQGYHHRICWDVEQRYTDVFRKRRINLAFVFFCLFFGGRRGLLSVIFPDGHRFCSGVYRFSSICVVSSRFFLCFLIFR